MSRTSETENEAFHHDRLVVLGQVAARGAHEINGQLMALFHVLASARALVERSGASTTIAPDVWLRQLSDADDALRRITRIAQSITTYARVPSEDVTELAVDEVVEGALRLGEVFLSGVAKVESRLTSQLTIRGCADALVQIVVNLLMNAGQAIQGGGGSTVWVESERGEGCAVVRVRDDGPGVPATIRARIFEPYVTTKAAQGGTGLGLAICRELAERGGGGVVLLPDGERGAAFELRLPLEPTSRVERG